VRWDKRKREREGGREDMKRTNKQALLKRLISSHTQYFLLNEKEQEGINAMKNSVQSITIKIKM